MKNKISKTNNNRYDLKERTTVLAETILSLIKKTKANDVNKNIVAKISRSGTSVGANYMEADGAESRKDFEHKMSICRKEAKETMYWVRLLSGEDFINIEECRKIWKEAQELVFIFSAIITSSRKNRIKKKIK